MDAKLVVVGGKATHQKIRLKLPTIVGRDQSAGLVVSHPTVSRKHCEICEVNGGLVIRDFGSANGTLLGEERVTEALLRPGDEITIGPLTFRADYDPEVEITAGTTLDQLKAGKCKKRVKAAPAAKKPAKKPVEVDDAADTMPLDSPSKAKVPVAKGPGKAAPPQPAKPSDDDPLEFDFGEPAKADDFPPIAFEPTDSTADERTVAASLDDFSPQPVDVDDHASKDEFDPLAFLTDAAPAKPAPAAKAPKSEPKSKAKPTPAPAPAQPAAKEEFDPLAFLTDAAPAPAPVAKAPKTEPKSKAKPAPEPAPAEKEEFDPLAFLDATAPAADELPPMSFEPTDETPAAAELPAESAEPTSDAAFDPLDFLNSPATPAADDLPPMSFEPADEAPALTDELPPVAEPVAEAKSDDPWSFLEQNPIEDKAEEASATPAVDDELPMSFEPADAAPALIDELPPVAEPVAEAKSDDPWSFLEQNPIEVKEEEASAAPTIDDELPMSFEPADEAPALIDELPPVAEPVAEAKSDDPWSFLEQNPIEVKEEEASAAPAVDDELPMSFEPVEETPATLDELPPVVEPVAEAKSDDPWSFLQQNPLEAKEEEASAAPMIDDELPMSLEPVEETPALSDELPAMEFESMNTTSLEFDEADEITEPAASVEPEVEAKPAADPWSFLSDDQPAETPAASAESEPLAMPTTNFEPAADAVDAWDALPEVSEPVASEPVSELAAMESSAPTGDVAPTSDDPWSFLNTTPAASPEAPTLPSLAAETPAIETAATAEPAPLPTIEPVEKPKSSGGFYPTKPAAPVIAPPAEPVAPAAMVEPTKPAASNPFVNWGQSATKPAELAAAAPVVEPAAKPKSAGGFYPSTPKPAPAPIAAEAAPAEAKKPAVDFASVFKKSTPAAAVAPPTTPAPSFMPTPVEAPLAAAPFDPMSFLNDAPPAATPFPTNFPTAAEPDAAVDAPTTNWQPSTNEAAADMFAPAPSESAWPAAAPAESGEPSWNFDAAPAAEAAPAFNFTPNETPANDFTFGNVFTERPVREPDENAAAEAVDEFKIGEEPPKFVAPVTTAKAKPAAKPEKKGFFAKLFGGLGKSKAKPSKPSAASSAAAAAPMFGGGVELPSVAEPVAPMFAPQPDSAEPMSFEPLPDANAFEPPPVFDEGPKFDAPTTIEDATAIFEPGPTVEPEPAAPSGDAGAFDFLNESTPAKSDEPNFDFLPKTDSLPSKPAAGNDDLDDFLKQIGMK
ncbi:MAG: FHA domain-containing protein [Planctomycetaceae bacterium]|nr:FHA domain-containing protein [Planctomycetaceae bacterium]